MGRGSWATHSSVVTVNNALTVHNAVRAGPHPACSTVSLPGIAFQVLFREKNWLLVEKKNAVKLVLLACTIL